jgi:uncharacterized protein YjbI with pentapeptide repeats
MDLLIVPFMLAIIGISFTLLLDVRQQAIEDRRAVREQRLENQRAQVIRETEDNRAQNEAVQAYLDAMDTLLKDESLRDSDATFIDRGLAQARTTTLIATLDAARNRIMTRFLRDLDLTPPPVSILREADLAGAELTGAILERADLFDANLKNADLRNADLRGADLSSARLSGADLTGANLTDANLTHANLTHANLSEAEGWTTEQLSAAKSLEGATMPDGQTLKNNKMPNEPTYEEWHKDKEGRG